MTAPKPPPSCPPAPLPTLSVVMPNYNHGHYLEAALRAHLDQSAPPLEIIVVDNASTDESCAVIERLAADHRNLRLVRSGRNGGVAAAMNRGLREARGDCVCFSAADDLVAPEFAGQSLRLLARHPAAAFCFSDVAVLLGDSGNVRRLPLFLSGDARLFSPLEMGRVLQRHYFNFPSHSILYRREALLEVGGFREDLQWVADWFTNQVLAFRHGACYVPRVLTFFRVSPGSYSARGARQTEAQRDLVYRMLDVLESDAFRDVARAFRDSAVVPELRPRVLLWLLASPRYRHYLTPRLLARLVFRGPWTVVRPYLPDGLQRAARWIGCAPRRRRVGGQAPRGLRKGGG